MTADIPPQSPALVAVARPLNIGLTPEGYAKVVSGETTSIATQRNPRKDRYFNAKRPMQARISALHTDQPPILRDIVRIEGTATEWRVFF